MHALKPNEQTFNILWVCGERKTTSQSPLCITLLLVSASSLSVRPEYWWWWEFHITFYLKSCFFLSQFSEAIQRWNTSRNEKKNTPSQWEHITHTRPPRMLLKWLSTKVISLEWFLAFARTTTTTLTPTKLSSSYRTMSARPWYPCHHVLPLL